MNRSLNLLLGLLLSVAVLGCGASHIPPDVRPDMTAMMEIRAKLTSGAGATSEVVEDLKAPTGFATLKGTFTLDGPAPENPVLTVTKDQGVCMPGGAPVKDNVVITGANGGLANVLIYVDGLRDEWCHADMKGSTEKVVFDQKQCLFLNRILPMQTTETLVLKNSDPVGHNADMKPAKNRPFNPNIAGGGEAFYPEDGKELKEERSPFTVSCAAHTWMKSYMIIRKNGYFAVTDDSGNFEIPNVPAGIDVKLVVWHEATRFIPKSALSNVPDVAKGWNKRGNFTVNLEPNQSAELQVAVNSSAFTK